MAAALSSMDGHEGVTVATFRIEAILYEFAERAKGRAIMPAMLVSAERSISTKEDRRGLTWPK
jgi:hypothetical protein